MPYRQDTVVCETLGVQTVGKNTVVWIGSAYKVSRWLYAFEIPRIEVEGKNKKWNVCFFFFFWIKC